MNRREFESLVVLAIDSLPAEFKELMENVDVTVEDYPSRWQLSEAEARQGYTLLGLYEGVPLTERGAHYGLVAPDKITIFQKPIEEKCRDGSSGEKEIAEVVKHEIAHHFGIGDDRLDQIEIARQTGIDKKGQRQ